MIKELRSLKKADTNYKRFKENILFFRTRGLDKLQERFDEDIVGYIQNKSKKQNKFSTVSQIIYLLSRRILLYHLRRLAEVLTD